jgi:hypothetical protein
MAGFWRRAPREGRRTDEAGRAAGDRLEFFYTDVKQPVIASDER